MTTLNTCLQFWHARHNVQIYSGLSIEKKKCNFMCAINDILGHSEKAQ